MSQAREARGRRSEEQARGAQHPSPPTEIADWLQPGWEDPGRRVEPLRERNEQRHRETVTVAFDEAPERMTALEQYRTTWSQWAEAERPARAAMRVLERLYELKGKIDLESEAPSDAARWIRERHPGNDWVPGPVERGAPLPLDSEELADLYASNADLADHEEREIQGELPDLTAFPNAPEFAEILAALDPTEPQELGAFWSRGPAAGDLVVVERFRTLVEEAATDLARLEPWQRGIVAAGHGGGTERDLWIALRDQVREAAARWEEARPVLLEREVALDGAPSLDEVHQYSVAIGAHLERFDVVIVDEASQSDVTGLLAWYLGDSVAVVGDHEQVSPLGVGQQIEVITALMPSTAAASRTTTSTTDSLGMARQAVLERAGWRFIRIRGTRFYRDPDATMAWVFEELERLGVVRSGAAPGQEEVDEEAKSFREKVVRRAWEIMRGRDWLPVDDDDQANAT